MAEKEKSINLLPRDSENFATQFFNWALSIGRLLIIITETVALATFIYRFSLDMQRVDLHDKIKSESFILDNFKSGEDTYVDLQNRLAAVKQYAPIGNRTETIFSDIIKMGQGTITFKDMTVNTQTATIEVQSNSTGSLTTFVNNMKNYPMITNVSIDKVESSPSSAQIILLITATLKQAPFAPQEVQENGTTEPNQAVLNLQ